MIAAQRSAAAAERTAPRARVTLVASIGFSLRNYVLGRCLDRLTEDADVTVVTPLAGSAGLWRALRARGAGTARLVAIAPRRQWRRARTWKQAMHVAAVYNDTWRLKRSTDHHESTLKQRVWNTVTFTAARLGAAAGLMPVVDRWEDRCALASPEAAHYRELFERERPSLVCSTAPLMAAEWLPLQVARSLGIRTAVAVLSFDNISSKSRLPLPCDAVLVWSERMADEVARYYPGLDPDSIEVTGAPQFDYYRDPRYLQTRTQFCAGVGADPRRPLVVYAGVTPSLMPHEPEIVASLAAAMRRGEVHDAAQLLVRLHPKDDGSRWQALRTAFPEVVFTVPGAAHHGRLEAWEPVDDDVRLMVNTVCHGDVHINVASTMTIDAAVADRPVINVQFDLRPAGAAPSWGLSIYRYTHYRPVVETGAMRLATSPTQLVEHVNRYLADPSLDAEGRQRLVAQECGVVDGHAGRRAAEALLSVVPVLGGERR